MTAKNSVLAKGVRKEISSLDGVGAPPLRILRGVDLDVAAGETVAIVGASGSGKTTLLSLLAGLDSPSAGEVHLDGDRIDTLDEDARAAHRAGTVGFVFQSFQLLSGFTALENVMLPAELAGLGDARARAREALARVGLSHLADRPARVLSGGEQQRVTLARAWALHPRTVFLDEPTAALDPGATRAIETIVRDIRAEGATVVMATHDMGQARRLADHVWFLDRGRLVEDRPAEDFFDKPQSPAAAAFVRGELAW